MVDVFDGAQFHPGRRSAGKGEAKPKGWHAVDANAGAAAAALRAQGDAAHGTQGDAAPAGARGGARAGNATDQCPDMGECAEADQPI